MGDETKDVKLPPCPKQVNHSSQNDLVLCLLLGIYYENDEIVWDCFEPSLRKAAAAANGGKAPKAFAKNIKDSMPQGNGMESEKGEREIFTYAWIFMSPLLTQPILRIQRSTAREMTTGRTT